MGLILLSLFTWGIGVALILNLMPKKHGRSNNKPEKTKRRKIASTF